MQYECLRMHLNHNLLCPKCLEAYFAVETNLTSATAQKKATTSAGMFKFNNNNAYCISCSSSRFGSTARIDALVKQKHPHWSLAAIKSTLMTTSMTLDRAKRPPQAQQYFESGTKSLVRATPLDFGSGHVNPRVALDPRLIFDAALAGGVGGCLGGGGGCRRSWRRLSPEVEEVCGGGKLMERKYG
ncbi:PA-domain containing subtilase family protein [Abeliophyllum distichum]|uniref:PA-domain containing subtilase family protein n=1 Tax=Abeliophyllum distichum TaxID=126358 RepID=A0ABD1SA92_9LAMI